MEEVPPDRERLYYMKCLAFILGIGMDVLLNYFEQKILGNSDFYCFVEDNKHYLYHAHNPSIKCCECSTLLLASSYKTRGLNKRQFEILFDIGLPTDMVHYQVGSNNQMTQDCLCRFMPKPSNDVDCMDITLMNAVIKACFFDRKLSIHGSPTDLETFKNTRNYLAHSSERRLSESEFKTKLQESEQAILGIAKSVGKYFAKESKRKIDAFKQDELSVAQIKRIIESNADGVSRELKKILDEQRNLPVHIQQVQEEIHRLLIKYKDELKVDIGNLSFDVRQNARWAISSSSREATLERRGPDQQTDIAAIGSSEQTTERVDNIHTCRVEWKLQTPGTWNLIKIQETLLNCSMLLQPWFKIEFVYIGSLVIKALVQKHTLDNRDKMRNSVHSFLKKIVEVCEINTEVSTVIKVDLMIELNELDHEKKGDQSLMLKAELEMEEDLMKLRPESEKGDQSLMLKAELEMEKDLVKLRPESEKGDKSLMLKAELEMEKDLVKLKPESEIGGDLMTLKAESGFAGIAK